MTDHYDARGRLLEEPDDAPVDEFDLDEARHVLAAARHWIETTGRPAYDDDAQAEKWAQAAESLREFASWLRSFVRAHVEREIADVDRRIGSAIDAAIRRHRDTEWHR